MMGLKGAVKRKSIKSNGTPNKIRKIEDVNGKTPNKSPAKNQKTPPKVNANKSQKTPQNKNKQIPVEKNKICKTESVVNKITSNKSPVKNQKTPEKKNKQIPEEEEQSENESEEHIETDSIEESDADEQNAFEDFDDEESDSDEDQEENEINANEVTKEEVDSNEESDADEQNAFEDFDDAESDSDEDQEENEENNAKENNSEPSPKKHSVSGQLKYTVFVCIPPETDLHIRDIFKDCNHGSYILLGNKNSFVDFHDEENYKKALLKNGTIINGARITVVPKVNLKENHPFSIIVRNLHTSKLETVFSDCKIVAIKVFTVNDACLGLEDEDSVQKALEKNQTNHDGSTIIVERRDTNVFVNGLTENMKIEEVFPDCKIHYYNLYTDKTKTGKFIGKAKICFADINSYKNALTKNKTEFKGKRIIVRPFKPLRVEERQFNNDRNKHFNNDRNKHFNNNRNKHFSNASNKNNSKNIESTLQLLKAQAWELNMNIKKLERQSGKKPFFKGNTCKSFVKRSFNPKNNE